MRKITAATIASAALVLAAGPALAGASFDTSGGTGFVGKGDVQVPFGWSNAQLQSNATGVGFTYTDLTEYEVTCRAVVESQETVIIGGKNQREVTRTRRIQVRSTFAERTAVVYDATTVTRKNAKGSVTGFKLLGQSEISSDPKPAEGDACSFEDETHGSLSGKLTDTIAVVSETGDTLTATHTGLGRSAVVWTDGVSTL